LQGLLQAEQDDRVLRRALSAGLLSGAALTEAEAAVEEGRAASLTEAVVAAGKIDRAALAALEEALAREDWGRPPVVRERETALPPEAAAVTGDPGRHLQDFILVDLRGRGGAGEVWRAWDRRLDRWVAVKLSTASLESASGRERFEREALAAARLRHPNIVPVYQVGAERGRPFLVMPFITGRTLEGQRLEVRRALEIVRTAARAVEHAHRQGLVHRDLKPANVMVDEAGEVFVLDFGLVYLRRESASRLTRPGDVLGTAAFMSPEQARSDEHATDVGTDIYGLGATLYALVTGRPPFEGDSFAAVVAKVLNEDPPPLRRSGPGLDARLVAVIARAMAKDPRQRYPSAAALAEDLDRLLAGRPPDARRPSVRTRLAAWARRHPVLATSLAAGVLALAGGAALRLRVEAERRAAVDALREVARLSLESALERRRAGDTRAMRRALPLLQAAYDKVRARGAREAEVEYLMGRMHRALMDEPKALAHQRQALALEPGYGPALYEQVVLLSAAYARTLDDAFAKLLVAEPLSRERVEAIERARPELATKAADLLLYAKRLEHLDLGQTRVQAARGIVAYLRGLHAEAREQLRRALATDPLMEEAWDALARAEEAGSGWRAAEATYGEALALDRGYAPHHIGRCELRRRIGRYREAVADADAAIAIDPGLIDGWICRAGAQTNIGHDLTMSNADARAAYAAAERDYDEVLRRSGGRLGHHGRGTLHRYRALYLMRTGGDPLPDLDASAADHDRSVALEPDAPEHFTGRGRTYGRRAVLRMERGQDASSDVQAAIADFTHAYTLDHRRADALMWRGDLYANRARFRAARGEAAWDDFAAASTDLEAALVQHDADPWAHYHRGMHRTWQAEAESAAGRDPTESLAIAQRGLTFAARRLPRYADPQVLLARVHLVRAAHLRTLGQDAAASLASAAFTLERALVVDPNSAEAWATLARLERLRGRSTIAALLRLRALHPVLAARVEADVGSPPAR
jgi:tetratricopeptide (TPR) repeat protein